MKSLTALADRGYYSGPQIRQCQLDGMTPLVPRTVTSGARVDGRFDKRDFKVILATRPTATP